MQTGGQHWEGDTVRDVLVARVLPPVAVGQVAPLDEIQDAVRVVHGSRHELGIIRGEPGVESRGRDHPLEIHDADLVVHHHVRRWREDAVADLLELELGQNVCLADEIEADGKAREPVSLAHVRRTDSHGAGRGAIRRAASRRSRDGEFQVRVDVPADDLGRFHRVVLLAGDPVGHAKEPSRARVLQMLPAPVLSPGVVQDTAVAPTTFRALVPVEGQVRDHDLRELGFIGCTGAVARVSQERVPRGVRQSLIGPLDEDVEVPWHGLAQLGVAPLMA